MTTREPGTGIPVTDAEVAEVLEDFRPGQVVPSFQIFVSYDRLMKEYGQPLASRVALGRALTAAGCEKVRKQRREKGKMTEVNCWRVPIPPGYNVMAEDERQARAVIDRMGPGIHPNASIYQAYLSMASEKAWRGRMSGPDLARVLTRLGLHRINDKGQPCRFVPDDSVPAPKTSDRPVPRTDFLD